METDSVNTVLGKEYLLQARNIFSIVSVSFL